MNQINIHCTQSIHHIILSMFLFTIKASVLLASKSNTFSVRLAVVVLVCTSVLLCTSVVLCTLWLTGDYGIKIPIHILLRFYYKISC